MDPHVTTGSTFPRDFVWGAATAAYQIEGSPTADGKGESIWDRFCRMQGTIANGDTGDVACDHYRLWREDVALMKELGLDAYRFSISWPRVLPEGRGKVNSPGLDFYDRLTDALLEAGIVPFVTLYHWDLPQALQDRGGWGDRDIAPYFAAYTTAVAERLGDRVKHWITLNEPWVTAFVGHLWGEHAPGMRSLRLSFAAAHNTLRAHGMAMQAIRAAVPRGNAGITLNLHAVHPARDTTEDDEAARLADAFHNRWFLEALFNGRYPDQISQLLADAEPVIVEGDFATIQQPMDFLGVNYYTRSMVRHRDRNQWFKDGKLPFETIKPDGREYTEMGWEVYPDGLRELLERLHRDYPVQGYYITENGAAFPDMVTPEGTVRDTRRQAYLESHFEAAARAISAGVPLKGYFVWSLLDNFEWALGYSRRFGLIYVDYKTQDRIWKDSARWYQRWLASRVAPAGR
ncbi:MAG: GH1 family beta-glucosidase [Chloroflexota bacterium]|nr:GH1 family beta-glucosidase [Chloroflexota bacterium]MDQ5864161.1 GH1 family beta-glucosidase [Chloroflexota bacterium]